MEHQEFAREFEAENPDIRMKLLYSRRLYLASICGDDDKRAAWEVLAGAVDWEKAKALQPQDNEPYGIPNAHKIDVLLPGEAGFMGDVAGGRDVKAELREAMRE